MILPADSDSQYRITYVYIGKFLLVHNRPKITMESESPYRKTYVYMQNFLPDGNRPQRTMDSDSPYRITYVYIYPMSIVLQYIKKSKNRKNF